MSNKKSSNKNLTEAHKTIKFWVKVLLTTKLLNDHQDRTELLEALDVLKQETKAKSGL